MPRKKKVTKRKTSRKERIESMHREVLDVDGAAEVLGVSRWTVLKMARAKKLPGKKVGKEWRFRLSTLLKWLGESDENGDQLLQKLLASGRVSIGDQKKGRS